LNSGRATLSGAARHDSTANLELIFMPPFKMPTFQERSALAAKARQAALDKLRAKPPIDEAVVAQRIEAARAREAALAKAREEKLAARQLEKDQKAERDAAAAVSKKTEAPALTAAEQKAARDARYAARKNRVGK
jgi:hypothetical protein